MTHEDLRPLMLSIAYRMVGSFSEAEDIVQDAFVRLAVAEDSIEFPKAWLTTVTTRLSIDHLRSARVRREEYPGTWLPEPLLADPAPDAAARAETADTLSLALLVVLESLSPVERAVFLLHDVFDYGYGEIAEIVEKSEDNCRQITVRARRHVDARRPRFDPSREQREELARRFFAAVQEGETEPLVELLAADVRSTATAAGRRRRSARRCSGPRRSPSSCSASPGSRRATGHGWSRSRSTASRGRSRSPPTVR